MPEKPNAGVHRPSKGNHNDEESDDVDDRPERFRWNVEEKIVEQGREQQWEQAVAENAYRLKERDLATEQLRIHLDDFRKKREIERGWLLVKVTANGGTAIAKVIEKLMRKSRRIDRKRRSPLTTSFCRICMSFCHYVTKRGAQPWLDGLLSSSVNTGSNGDTSQSPAVR